LAIDVLLTLYHTPDIGLPQNERPIRNALDNKALSHASDCNVVLDDKNKSERCRSRSEHGGPWARMLPGFPSGSVGSDLSGCPPTVVHRDGDIGTGTTRESGDGASDGSLTGYSAAPLLDGHGFRG
jgi:hypothetical protein